MIIFKTNCVEHSSYNEYGVDAFQNGQLVKSSPCITDSFDEINKLVALFNELEIELCHFDDIIEDYLTDFCI